MTAGLLVSALVLEVFVATGGVCSTGTVVVDAAGSAGPVGVAAEVAGSAGGIARSTEGETPAVSIDNQSGHLT
jgi:hypothetical protein